MLAYSFFILILGAFYARMSSSLASYFNEASYIAIIMYSISLLAFIAVPVAFAIEGAFEAQFLVTTLAICMGVCVTTGVMVIPKVRPNPSPHIGHDAMPTQQAGRDISRPPL